LFKSKLSFAVDGKGFDFESMEMASNGRMRWRPSMLCRSPPKGDASIAPLMLVGGLLQGPPFRAKEYCDWVIDLLIFEFPNIRFRSGWWISAKPVQDIPP